MSWYLRYPLSYRDIEELLLERGLEVDRRESGSCRLRRNLDIVLWL